LCPQGQLGDSLALLFESAELAAYAGSRRAVWTKRAALLLVRRVQSLVRMCFWPSSALAF